MRTCRKRALTASVVALVLFALTGTSGANTLQLTETTFRTAYRSLEFTAAGSTVRCPVTLEGSFHSASISKTGGALLGHVTRVSTGTCTGGTVTALTGTLPWHVQYSSFAGTLPNITSVRLQAIGASFQVHPTGLLTCLARSEASHAVTLGYERTTQGEITGVRAGGTIPLTGEGGLCAAGGEASLGGTGTTTVLGETTPIAVFLEETGVVLESESQRPIPALNIPRENVVGTRVINNGIDVPVKIKAIFTFGLNEEKFRVKQEEAGACRNEMVLLANSGNNCRIVVEYVGPPIPRTAQISTTVIIQVRVGQATLSGESMTVNAQ